MRTAIQTALSVFTLLCVAPGCTSLNQQVSAHQPSEDRQPDPNVFKAKDTSQQLYMLALSPANAFTTQDERNALWAALRGDDPTVVKLLGPIDSIPMDYRIEYVFNHTTPDSPEAELEQLTPWMKRLPKDAKARVRTAQTLLLVKGTLDRLPNAQETRLTLAGLVFLAERYNGVVFDLLNRQALTAAEIRTRLSSSQGLAPQVRLIGALVDGHKGIRSVGLPKYGLFDVFLASADPREDSAQLGMVIDTLLKGDPLPSTVDLKPCKSTRLDYGCYRVLRR